GFASRPSTSGGRSSAPTPISSSSSRHRASEAYEPQPLPTVGGVDLSPHHHPHTSAPDYGGFPHYTPGRVCATLSLNFYQQDLLSQSPEWAAIGPLIAGSHLQRQGVFQYGRQAIWLGQKAHTHLQPYHCRHSRADDRCLPARPVPGRGFRERPRGW